MANKAGPSSTLGQALGQYGINIMEFCKEFNKQTEKLRGIENQKIPTTIKVKGRKFEIKIKTPSTTTLMKNTVLIKKGSKEPGKKKKGEIKKKEIYHIAKLKKSEEELNRISIKGITKTIGGTAKSMGLKIT